MSVDDQIHPLRDFEALPPVSQPVRPARRRVSRRTLLVAALLVLLVAGVATLGALLIQTRGVLDYQKQQTHGAQVQRDTANVALTATRNDLTVSFSQLVQAQLDLSTARSNLGQVTGMLANAVAAGNDLEKCYTHTLDASLANLLRDYAGANDAMDAAKPYCDRGLKEWVATAGAESAVGGASA